MISLKFFLLSKRSIFIVFTIILIIVITLYFNNSFPIATELMCNSEVSNGFMDKVKNLTSGEEKIAYLTFDDGPTTSVTPKILDILKSENVKATFFVIGKSVDAHPEIVKRAYEEGHYIANHGYDHKNSVLYKSSESFINEVTKTDLAIGNAIGVENYCSYVFRFPNGFMAPLYKAEKEKAALLLSQMNYAYVDWNCLNNDSVKKYSEDQLLENLKRTAKGKNTLVVLMHDTKDVSDSSTVLKASIDYLKSEGYEFRNFYDLVSSQTK